MKTPPDSSSPPQALLSGQERYHDLDALRAFAMLLGIVLHGVMSFTPLPGIWPAQDAMRHENYFLVLLFIHGFRMPLFFMVSGFFTVMMWRRRGLAALTKHRTKRILIPLVAGVIILVPDWLNKRRQNSRKMGSGPLQSVVTLWPLALLSIAAT